LKLDKLQRIAVIGPNAAELHLGGYSGETEHGVSILEGIRRRAAGKAEVVYAQGCAITESKPAGHEDSPKPPDAKLDEKRIAEAVALAKSAGVAVLVLGEDEQISREAWSAAHPGDRDDLNLVGRQDELLRRVQETGTPVVVILIHGRPLSIGYVAAHAPAIVDGWYLGQEGGNAMAAVLFGDYNPGGKLPVTVPRNVGQLPVFYNQKPTAKRGYVWSDKTPLYPFGYGLSYTSFHLRNLRVEPRTIDAGGSATVTVEVTNTGSREGSQVVQMYIRDEVSSVTRPVKELRGFERLWLKPGESRQVSFTLGPEELRFYNREMKRVVEPGEFTVMIGFDSKEVESTTLMVK
jgi:beta-glucosidase